MAAPMSIQEYLAWAQTKEAKLPNHERLAHALFGLTTEAGEYLGWWKKFLFYNLDFETKEAQKELGDICFYAAILLNLSESQIDQWPMAFPFERKLTGNLIELANEHRFELFLVIDNISLPQEKTKLSELTLARARLAGVTTFGLVIGICRTLGWDFAEIINLNVEKLNARYPQGFTSTHAAERLDEKSV